MPSPGISVTVYLPPYLVGLKRSDWTVVPSSTTLAKPRAALKRCEGWAAARRRRWRGERGQRGPLGEMLSDFEVAMRGNGKGGEEEGGRESLKGGSKEGTRGEEWQLTWAARVEFRDSIVVN